MKWDEYIKDVVTIPSPLDQLTITLSDYPPIPIPPVIKATLHILEKMGESKSIHNVIVFPERILSGYLLMISSVIHNIVSGKIEWGYDPKQFMCGQKLKYGNCVMEFIEIKDKSNETMKIPRKRMFLKFADGLIMNAAIEDLPFFQKTDTNRRLSPYQKYSKAYSAKQTLEHGKGITKKLQNYKTHMTSSVFYVAPIGKTNELLSSTLIDDEPAREHLLIGDVDYEGNVCSCGTGQLDGIPAIVLSANLLHAAEAVENGEPVQSVIVDISSENSISSSLPGLDRLCQNNIPLVCVTDTANSLDLQHLEDRGFNIWRWNAESLTVDLMNPSLAPIDTKMSNCVRNEIEYTIIPCADICEPKQILDRHSEEIEQQSPKLIKVHEHLWDITFRSLRMIVESPSKITDETKKKLSVCANNLASERNYISEAMHHDLMTAVTCFENIYNKSPLFPKADTLENSLVDGTWRKICIVIPNGFSLEDTRSFWTGRLAFWEHDAEVEVMNPREFLSQGQSAYDVVIIAGWLGKDVMRKILFSYNAARYQILLYDCEESWRNASLNRWNRVMNNTGNFAVAEHCLSGGERHIDTTIFEPIDPMIEPEGDTPQDSDDIDHLFRMNKYRHYIAAGPADSTDPVVDAFYVNYVGEYFSFLTATHKILTVTDIILNDGDQAKRKTPDELGVGDFVVMRTASRDLIREYADRVLEENNMEHCRKTVEIWKKALRKERESSSFGVLHHNLQAAGCERNMATIRNWLTDDDMIIPEDQDDLRAIALVSKDPDLQSRLNEVFETGRVVRSAHIKAGRIISEKLRRRIATELQKRSDVDVHNILDSFTFEIDEGLTVHVLKIIDINRTPVQVKSQDTNRLLSE